MARIKLKRTLMYIIGVVVLIPIWYQFILQISSDKSEPNQVYMHHVDPKAKPHPDSALMSNDKRPFAAILYLPENKSVSASKPVILEDAQKKEVSDTLMQEILNRRPATPSKLAIPGVDIYLPHTQGNVKALKPLINVSKGRTGVQLVIGVPTIHRPTGDYLEETMQSLISNLQPTEAKQVLIIVFVSEPWNTTHVNFTIDKLESKFPSEMSSGLIDIMSPPPDFYPDLDRLKLTLNDSKNRVKWRTKQNLDYSFLMLQAYQRGKFYIQLEDDVITKPGFFKFIMSAVSAQNADWMILKFSSLGFIGKLIRARDLPFVLEFLLMFHAAKPGDWLLDNLLTTMICGKDTTPKDCGKMVAKVAREIKPSQFQHIGYHSSLSGKIQKLKDKTFIGRPGLKSKNPVCVLSTSLSHYKTYRLQKAYDGTNIFWATTPKKNDTIEFTFTKSVVISKYLLESGVNEHPSDMFPKSTVVEVLPDQPPLNNVGNFKKSDYTNSQGISDFYHVGNFDVKGTAQGNLTSLGKIKVFRIRVTAPMETWVILRRIELHTT